ncbi:MAG: NAD(P)/FAD-dependent oxidoreductase, partial [Ilumatobacteraceae bacterium]
AEGVGVSEVLAASFPDFLDNRLRAFMVSSFLAFDLGDLDELASTLYDGGDGFGGPEVFVTNGYDRVAAHLADGLEVVVGDPVVQVVDDTTGVTVRTASGDHVADAVVVTVPLGVLKADVITFDPPLPAATVEAIDAVGFGNADKFLFMWDEPFWDDTDLIVYTPDRLDVFAYIVNLDALVPGSAALITFAYADEALASESRTDDEMIELMMVHLRDVYGPDTPQPRAMRRSAWGVDPFTRGSYSFPSTTTEMRHFDQLATPHGRIHFAGEHTNREHFASTHGAYLSGVRAADEIMAADRQT